MKVLGIDPAIASLGWALLWTNPENGSDVELLEFGTLQTDKQADEGSRLLHIRRWLEVFLETRQPAAIAMERPVFFGQLGANSLGLGMACGVVKVVCAGAGVAVTDYGPAAIKKGATGDGRAKKPAIRAAIKARFGDSLKGPDDGFDAIAVALTHAARLNEATAEWADTQGRIFRET